MKKTGLLLLFTFLISSIAFAKQPSLEFSKTEHNFGTIKEEIGAVTTQFEFTNTGDSPLIIQRVLFRHNTLQFVAPAHSIRQLEFTLMYPIQFMFLRLKVM